MTDNYVTHVKGDVVEQSLKKRGYWVVTNIIQTIGWPEDNVIIKYEEVDVHILGYNGERDHMPAVAVFVQNGLDKDAAQALIMRFLSAVNWANSGSIRVEHTSGGSAPFRSLDKGNKYKTTHFQLPYIPSNLNKDQQLALALYREGNSLINTHYGYSFLSFYKIINLVKKNGGKQKKWIRANLDGLKAKAKPNYNESGAKKRMDELTAAGEVVDDYLFVSCRCALAHAGVEPTVDPDNINDSIRLYKDLALIKYLAQRMIEDHFGIKSDGAVYGEHLYELAGFKELLGNDVITGILDNDAMSRRKVKIDKKISIRQWHDKHYGVFECLNLKTKAINNAAIYFDCVNDDNTFKVPLILDLKNERIYLEIEDTVINASDEKLQLQYEIDWNNYLKDYICNGQLEIFLSDNNQQIARKDANMPVNIDLGRTVESFDARITQLQNRLAKLV